MRQLVRLTAVFAIVGLLQMAGAGIYGIHDSDPDIEPNPDIEKPARQCDNVCHQVKRLIKDLCPHLCEEITGSTRSDAFKTCKDECRQELQQFVRDCRGQCKTLFPK